MDDLLGEDWQKPAKAPSYPSTSAVSGGSASTYTSFRASPQPQLSGNSTPQNISRPSSTVTGSKQSSNDTFGSLLSLKSQKSSGNVSMQEKQRQLIDEKRRQQEAQSQLWENLGSGRGTPEVRQPSPAAPRDDENDLLAAFNKDAPVNKASHFAPPPPSRPVSGSSTPAGPSTIQHSAAAGGSEQDDDLFGLGLSPARVNGHVHSPSPQALDSNDDDILGDLAKPVTASNPAIRTEPTTRRIVDREVPSRNDELQYEETVKDGALAELIDMGFPAETAKIALSENGGDVQQAVGWLLQQAHEESKRKMRDDADSRRRSPANGSRSPQRRQREDQESMPAWMKQESRSSADSRRQNTISTYGEKDAAQMAQELSNKLFQSANSLWKAGQKQVAKTMADFQQEGDPSQPKWMRSAATQSNGQRQRAESSRAVPVDTTQEAAMLDAPREQAKRPSRPTSSSRRPDEFPVRNRTPVESLPLRTSSESRHTQQVAPQSDRRPITKLSRQEVEDQTAQAYVSPARRKPPKPRPEPVPEPDTDLFSSAAPQSSIVSSRGSLPIQPAQTPPVARPAPAPRPEAPPRKLPPISANALSVSASHRKAGGEHFKRGDYASAHDSYTAALNPLPAGHPIAIIVLSNRALTALKTGDAKAAVADANRALEVIGTTLGVGESIDLGPNEGVKEMKEFYAKAIMRKAEALELLERYSDAAAAWRQAIAVGAGGAVSIRGRDRCDQAVAPKPPRPSVAKPIRTQTPSVARPTPPAKSLGNSLRRPALTTPTSAAAVNKLRAANAAAEKADDEKFALADTVDAKLAAWRGGKTDNLRALLQSMDAVLWEGAGWKKVGMSDLVMTNKVKIIYMKAIAKVHPDKIPQDATTEQRMISAAVFSTLNEAWDKFKKDNSL